MTYPAYATAFEVYPKEGEAYDHLSPLLSKLARVDFTLRVDDPRVNQGQIASDFDKALELALVTGGAQAFDLRLPSSIPQEHDFAFTYGKRTVAVEIEKANREKILRDILKCHMYLHCGVDLALICLPRNYPHKHGIWNLFDFGVQRYRECSTYGFGSPDRLGKILLLGFDQHEAATGHLLSKAVRERIRVHARGGSQASGAHNPTTEAER